MQVTFTVALYIIKTSEVWKLSLKLKTNKSMRFKQVFLKNQQEKTK